MYLADLSIENFRVFGAEADGEHLAISLGDGLNVLVGENDSGKSSIIDAVRLLLSARGQDALRLTDDDFHVRNGTRVSSLTVQGTFKNLTDAEHSRFLEWLSLDGDVPELVISLQATRREVAGRSRRIFVTTRAGRKVDGPALEGEVRDFLQATYLRPLRDAEAELSGGRGSRLSQILEAHPDFKKHAEDDSTPTTPPTTLVGIMRKAERDVKNSTLVKQTADTLSDDYLAPLSLGSKPLVGEMGIARNVELRHVLEKLELWLAPTKANDLRTRRGLGLNNILFMAAELLLLAGEPEASLGLLLIEEPEAHLHPQLQARLIEFLEQRSTPARGSKVADETAAPKPAESDGQREEPAQVQVLLTTHSPQFASKVDLARLILVAGGRCFPLAPPHTKLADWDYGFLRRFLDVTKANLFFARGVLIVEGDAENLLLPVIAKKIGRPLAQHGVSIVNVGSRGLSRYSRIFQRAQGGEIDVRVACVTDLDLVPATADYAMKRRAEDAIPKEDDADAQPAEAGPKKKAKQPPTPDSRLADLRRHDGGPVKTFVSPCWTLEHDLALSGVASLLHRAVFIGRKMLSREKNRGEPLSPAEREKASSEAATEFAKLEKDAAGDAAKVATAIYEPLFRKQAAKPEVAELLAESLDADPRSAEAFRAALPPYLVEAIDYVTRRDEEPVS